jgi:SAM-dependent methyltransferase
MASVSEDERARAEDPWGYGKRFRFVVRAVERRWPGREPSSIQILDVGCGNGSQLALPVARIGYTLVGVDPDGPSIEKARASAPENARFECCYLRDVEPRGYDVVLLSEVLEHVEDPAAVLGEAVEYLSGDGILIVTVPNGSGEFEIDNYFFRALRIDRLVEPLRRHRVTVSGSDCQDGHVQFFRLRTLRRLFATAGLEVVGRGSGTLACGQLAVYAFNWLPSTVLTWNARITDWLPMSFASGWYFVLCRAVAPECGRSD